ncbi:ABC transporter permease subunit [Nocardioides daphniae]|uniref:ABC transporter permease n=1 Tax=Nocardioides daphniae TaxID=402297 RepID=A0A4V1CWP1_9ACTN|nr:ABC transporter permease subunit [Nocardioides daphniae]QCC77947.1 ABC transporter permease [Nocardioides daphniae]GGD23731.1 ABC transporter permease [Nocardioides daphniae]
MNPTIARLALAALAGRKRFIILLLFPLLLTGLTVLIRVLTGEPELATDAMFGLGLSVVLPLLALVGATAVMGPEVDDGSIVYLLAKPISRHSVAVSKYVVALGSVLLLGPVLMLVTGVAVNPGDAGDVAARSLGGALSAAAYAAFFLALSTVWKHAVVAGLLFVLLWEGTLANVFSGVAWLSIYQWGHRVARSLTDGLAGPDIALWWAAFALAVVTVGGVWLSGDRLRSFALKGDD